MKSSPSLSRLLFFILGHMACVRNTSSAAAFGMDRVGIRTSRNCNSLWNSCLQENISMKLKASKWDNLQDEDDDDEEPFPVPPDMKYVPRNILRQSTNFQGLKGVGGKEIVNDIYVREQGSDTFWYVGKVARISDVAVEQAVARQWPLIQMHAALLRLAELNPTRNRNEIWVAPGDSELDVAYCRPDCTFIQMYSDVEGAKGVKASFVGFEGEVYDPGEAGFRTQRTDDGKPAKPEVMVPSEGESVNREPANDEMEELIKTLENQGLGDVFEQ